MCDNRFGRGTYSPHGCRRLAFIDRLRRPLGRRVLVTHPHQHRKTRGGRRCKIVQWKRNQTTTRLPPLRFRRWTAISERGRLDHRRRRLFTEHRFQRVAQSAQLRHRRLQRRIRRDRGFDELKFVTVQFAKSVGGDAGIGRENRFVRVVRIIRIHFSDAPQGCCAANSAFSRCTAVWMRKPTFETECSVMRLISL